MHEYSVVRALIERVEGEARARHAVRVRRLSVQVGELSGVDADLLRTAYNACRVGTLCEAAALDLMNVQVRWTCSQCAAGVPPDGPRTCRMCGAAARLSEGEELLLDRIEMEVADV